MTDKTNTGSDAVDLDKLEALAKAVDGFPDTIQPFVSTGGQVVIHTFSMSREQVDAVAKLYDAANPSTLLALIAQARAAVSADRAQQGEPVDERASFEEWWAGWGDRTVGIVEYSLKREAAMFAWKARGNLATKAAAPTDAPLLRATVEREQALAKAGFAMTAELLGIDGPTIKGVDYLPRNAVMDKIVAWRTAFDSAPKVDAQALRAALVRTPAEDAREQIARAICTACEENPEHKGDARGNQKRWQDYLPVADAAISAGAKRLNDAREPKEKP